MTRRTPINDLDRKVLEQLDGRDKIKALLKARGLQLKDFAEKYNLWVMNVSRCLSGERPLPEIRDHLAGELEMARKDIDRLIDGDPKAASAA